MSPWQENVGEEGDDVYNEKIEMPGKTRSVSSSTVLKVTRKRLEKRPGRLVFLVIATSLLSLSRCNLKDSRKQMYQGLNKKDSLRGEEVVRLGGLVLYLSQPHLSPPVNRFLCPKDPGISSSLTFYLHLHHLSPPSLTR
jgi:hypothetical protein